jgi:four helix bundle protein
MTLAELIYRLTHSFPREELYDLTSQLRRASVSVPSNIAEGQARLSTSAFKNHLSIARGSLAELSTQVELASRLGLVPDSSMQAANDKIQTVGKLLNGLLRAL